jgi:hypothetical protein
VTIHRNRANAGAVLNCQRAFWLGDADFVVPKTADDLLAPDFIERIMLALAAHPNCATCHAAGLVFTGPGIVRQTYPQEPNLHAVGPDRIERARHVMRRYTSTPSFWGIYRRAVTDRLARIPYGAGWDHALLAELALYAEIRHVPDTLFWRRDGGKPVQHLAPGCTEYAQRGLDVNESLAELRWRTPLIITAYAHIEAFALAQLPPERRTSCRTPPTSFGPAGRLNCIRKPRRSAMPCPPWWAPWRQKPALSRPGWPSA